MIIKRVLSGIIGLGMALVFAASVQASDDIRSGYSWATKDTQALQDDEMQNPGILWVESGEDLWSKAEGDEGKSCSSCHNDAADTMKSAAVSYPKYKDSLGKLQNLEQRINQCRTENMKAKAWKWESEQLLGMTTYVRHQGLGLPVTVAVDGPNAPFFKKGEKFFSQRRGLLDMSCKNCHEDNAGNVIRANMLTQGQVNGFPVYRLKWGKVGSSHRRFRGCNKNVRAKPYKNGSDEYVNLELYLAWRGRGLPVETPAVRN